MPFYLSKNKNEVDTIYLSKIFQKQNTFFKNSSFNLVSAKNTRLDLISTFNQDLIFFFNNPLYFKLYNYANLSRASENILVSSYYTFFKKISVNTNLLADTSIFSFNLIKDIFFSNSFRRIKTTFSYLPYETMLKFIEYSSGRKALIKIDPFLLKSVSSEDVSRCFM